MARNHSFRRGGISPSQKRKKTWTAIQIGTAGPLSGTLAAPASQLAIQDIFTFTPRPDVEDSTVIRTHLEANFNPKAVTNAGTAVGATFAIGVAVVNFEAGLIAAVPEVASSSGAAWDGWFSYSSFSWNPGPGGSFIESRRMEIDSKAMRKLEGGNVLVFAVGLSSSSTGNTGTIEYAVGGRFLTMLP